MSDDAPGGGRTPRRRWRGPVILLAAAIVLAAGVAAGAGLWHVSASPRFCNSCHIMRPYVDAWKASSHAAVACVECHYPPGLRDTLRVKFQAVTQVAKWATGTYSSKPFAEVEDASCLRSGCHARTDLERKGELTSRRGIRFDHARHLTAAMGRELRCTSCHAQMVVDRHFEVTQSACFTCHFKARRNGRELIPVAGCTGCHGVPRGDIVVGSVRFNHDEVAQRGVACQSCHLSVVEGRGDAPRERCMGCHNQREVIAKYDDARLVHAAHVSARSIECTRCHSEIKHRLPPRIGPPTADAAPPALAVLATGPGGGR
ncbi:MAG TPA: NapC/NirT family cytochrome c [Methylomirabilota bacterium]|nr:NapC/NirT family cytochrome c [Methylomirabilota bacterium]